MSQNQKIFGILFIIIAGIVGYLIGNSSSHNKHMSMNANKHNMSMESMMMDMNASLRGKTGDEFDKAFLKEMIVHHEGAVAMAEMVLTSSDRQELRDLANEIIQAQAEEIEQMKTWEKQWFE
jgi:uncharacterized protein (DUF305 family)